MSKALRKQGAEVLSEKKYPLPVNGLHSGLETDHRVLLLETICVSPVVLPLPQGKPRLRSAAKENGEGPMLQRP